MAFLKMTVKQCCIIGVALLLLGSLPKITLADDAAAKTAATNPLIISFTLTESIVVLILIGLVVVLLFIVCILLLVPKKNKA